MKVRELIDLLKDFDPEAEIRVWNAYNDRPSKEVHVSVNTDGAIMIADWR